MVRMVARLWGTLSMLCLAPLLLSTAAGSRVAGTGGYENIVIRVATEVGEEDCVEMIGSIKVSDDRKTRNL